MMKLKYKKYNVGYKVIGSNINLFYYKRGFCFLPYGITKKVVFGMRFFYWDSLGLIQNEPTGIKIKR